MFVQVIRATTKDPEGVRKHGDRWYEELRPGAEGFLGMTAGVSTDGKTRSIVRFADEGAARRNAERPEQGEWWAGMEKLLDGVTFAESTEVETLHGGGSDDAGFVQVMEGTYTDADALRSMTADAGEMLSKVRPDLLGVLLRSTTTAASPRWRTSPPKPMPGRTRRMTSRTRRRPPWRRWTRS